MKSVLEEKLKLKTSENNKISLTGLKILGCSKTYKINNGFFTTKNLQALKDVKI